MKFRAIMPKPITDVTAKYHVTMFFAPEMLPPPAISPKVKIYISCITMFMINIHHGQRYENDQIQAAYECLYCNNVRLMLVKEYHNKRLRILLDYCTSNSKYAIFNKININIILFIHNYLCCFNNDE